jgi:thymidylate kinase
MQKVIIYNNITGHIEQNIKIASTSLEKMLTGRSHLSSMEYDLKGKVDDYQINVSVDPHVVEAKPEPTIDVSKEIRIQRRNLLAVSDWTQAQDSPLSDSKKAEWQTYRQALRDMPDTYSSETDIENVIWPTRPS